jgi:serine/threonine protein kinase
MNAKANPHDEATAVSGAAVPGAARGLDEVTDATGPADVTIVRTPPAAATVNDKKGPPDSFGKYELLGEVARGGMGVVYRARHKELDRLVALKMVLGTGVDHESVQRFLQEARAAAALDHPNVVPIYDIGEDGGKPYFTMALVDGPNLRGHSDAHGPIPIAAVVSLFAQVVAGVAHAHKHGIIHRDLKPANVLIDRDGRPRVTDFGLAKRATGDSQLTVTGQVVGTPQYMAPEQARESKDVGPAADVYSLGAILYFLLTGRPPFSGESFTDLLLKVMQERPVSPRQLRPDVPADLEALCLQCLAKAPAERVPDAQALADALAPIAAQYLAPSASLAPSLARGGAARVPAAGTSPELTAPSAAGPVLSSSLTAVVPPEAKSNRRPLLVCAAVIVAFLGLIGYLVTRDKKPEVAMQEPVPFTPAGQTPAQPLPGAPGTPNPAPAVATPGTPAPNSKPVPPPDAAGGDKLAWPAPARGDFGLKFELAAVGAPKGADEVIPVAVGTPVILRVTAEKECRVRIWLIEPNGHTMQVFPNEYDTDDHLKAGQTRVIGETRSALLASATTGAFDRLRVIATTGEPPAYPPGAKVNQYTVYATDADRERLASTVRGLVIKKAGTPGAPGAVAEAELRFRAK